LKRVLTVITAVFVLGCASAPDRKPPTVDLEPPEDWTGGDVEVAIPDSTAAEWWRGFEDTSLVGLVDEALRNNFDILAAGARVDQAVAQARLAGADVWPQLGMSLNGGRARSNFIGFPGPGGQDVLTVRSNSFGASLDLSWEIDLWGRIRKGQEAALADVQASWADLAAVRMSIAAQTVKSYFAVLEARDQVVLTEQIVGSFRSSAEQVRRRYEEGVVSSVDLRLALSAQANSEALLALRRQLLDGGTRQLEILLGRYPAAAVDAISALPGVEGEVPGGLPSELLLRRPDLLAAERRWAASESRVSSARRAFFPRIALTGSAGTSSNQLEDIVALDFGVWSFAAGLVQPIFQGGRLRANLQQSHAIADQTLVAYVQSLQRAFGEVEIALVAERMLVEQQTHLAEAARQSEAARQLAERQYNAGLADFITVLETQRQSFTAQIDLLTVRRQRLDARVNLHLALGGGFDLTSEWSEFLEQSNPRTLDAGGSQ